MHTYSKRIINVQGVTCVTNDITNNLTHLNIKIKSSSQLTAHFSQFTDLSREQSSELSPKIL